MKIKTINYFFTYFFIAISVLGNTQDDLLDKLEKEYPKKPIFELATFKTTRIGLGQSVELRKKGALEISLFNRFWNREEKSENRFIADEVSLRFGLNYAISNNLTVGAGYTSFDNIADGFFKYKLLKQQKQTSKAPVSIVLFQGFSHRSKINVERNLYAEDEVTNSDIYSFVSQILIAKKFNTNFSAQLSPSYIFRNKSFLVDQPKNQFAVGLGARYKIGGHLSITSEYYHTFNPTEVTTIKNPIMIGFNWELSHLLLQFQMTNTRHFTEDVFITQTQNHFNFKDGNLHFGFNAVFVLHTKKNKLKN